MGKYQKNIEAARRISVVQYLETYHPGELVRKTDKEYCTKTHSSLVITPANGLFHWFSQSKGGNNALDYLVKVEGMDFVSAVRLLNEMTPMPVSVQTVKAAPVQQQTSRPFVLPPADRNTEAATAYLLHRGISPKVLRYCVVVESYTKPRAATTATAFLWAKMKTAYRALLFSAAVKAAFAEMSRAAKNSMAF